MKKIVLTFAITFFGIGLYAQEGLKLGIQGGLPFDDFNDEIGVVVGADLGYMWALGEVVDLGIMTGYIYGFPEKFETENPLIDLPSIQFMPISASLRVWTSNSFSFGVNAGQAIGLNDGNDGGFYYRPQIGYLMGPFTEFNISYTSIKIENRSWTTVTIGILHTFELKKRY
tara:strand:+ start:250797 stop:251309 length:513 start_codon:yes stop_codon:yes gene_type:complete